MLRFYFGASGAGKSTQLHKELIRRSIESPEGKYLIVVPDQFTMQTQKDLVLAHPAGGIMNIDVLSFSRLTHRIFDEVGYSHRQVLTDTGKSLILRRVADKLGSKLPVIGGNLHKSGYIDEVKSTISEFMQYGIGKAQISALEEAARGRGALQAKLKDLGTLYQAFLDYIRESYLTTEETLDLLCQVLPESSLVRGSILAFDGFTGFTPIQYRVIEELLSLAKEVIVTITIDAGKDPYGEGAGDQDLFRLSRKTVGDLERIAYTAATGELPGQRGSRDRRFAEFIRSRRESGGDILLSGKPVRRLVDSPELSFLEANLFRYPSFVYEENDGADDQIALFEASTPENEVRQVCIKIRDQIRKTGAFYRDFAIVAGSLDTYGDLIAREALKFHIPVYIDRTQSIRLSPFIEYIKSAIRTVSTGFGEAALFHYLRSGMTDFDMDQVDVFETYVRAVGIRGKKAFLEPFFRHMPKRRRGGSTEDEIFLKEMNEVRQGLIDDFSPLLNLKEKSALSITKALYQMIVENRCQEKLKAMAENFQAAGDAVRAREYSQIYRKVMDLLDELASLLGEEKVSLEEYLDILDAGFGDIEVGTIPQNVDRVMVGDIERTRLSEVDYLFFIGVNDNAIPGSADGGGILSDIDRQFLADIQSDVELAPTPRQLMYIQRLYLYMNLTKPVRGLTLSFCRTSADGKSIQPAYLIDKVRTMFPLLTAAFPEEAGGAAQFETLEDGLEQMAVRIRDYVSGSLNDQGKKEFYTLYYIFSKKMGRLMEAAYSRYRHIPLTKETTAALYGTLLENSVSRLEQLAACSYAHFLRYGLRLADRQEYTFNAADIGTVYHGVLEAFAGRLSEEGLDFLTFTKEEGEAILTEVMTQYLESFGENVFLKDARSRYMTGRMHRVLSRTLGILQYQLSKGSFMPAAVELDFREAGRNQEVSLVLSRDDQGRAIQRMQLQGRIDRLDLCQEDGKVYVKILDFKSGMKTFQLPDLYYGLQLQLVLYMNVALAMEKRRHRDKEIVPAALLYYHVTDPLIKAKGEVDERTIDQEIRKGLRTTGLVNADEKILTLLDHDFTSKSDVIPAERKKDGSFAAASGIMEGKNYDRVADYVRRLILKLGRQILSGDIDINPYEKWDKKTACTYCPYRSICRIDPSLPGSHKRELPKLSDEDVLGKISGKHPEENEKPGKPSGKIDLI